MAALRSSGLWAAGNDSVACCCGRVCSLTQRGRKVRRRPTAVVVVTTEETEEEDVAEERDDTCWCCYCQPREEGSVERERGLVIGGWGERQRWKAVFWRDRVCGGWRSGLASRLEKRKKENKPGGVLGGCLAGVKKKGVGGLLLKKNGFRFRFLNFF